MRKSLLLAIAVTLLASTGLVSAQRTARPVFGGWHAAAPISRSVPVTHAPQAAQPRTVPNGTIHGTPYYHGTTHYMNPSPYNHYYARHPNMYPGSWVYAGGYRWYNGYWHSYWASAHWVWFGGFYGFWFPLNSMTVFVSEAAPGVCQYWDGYGWVPYYDPATGYYCPY